MLSGKLAKGVFNQISDGVCDKEYFFWQLAENVPATRVYHSNMTAIYLQIFHDDFDSKFFVRI